MIHFLDWPDYNVSQVIESQHDYQVCAGQKYTPPFYILFDTSNPVRFIKKIEILMVSTYTANVSASN